MGEYWKALLGGVIFLLSGPWWSLYLGAGVVAERGSCSAEHRHMQFFPLSCSLYNKFLKS